MRKRNLFLPIHIHIFSYMFVESLIRNLKQEETVLYTVFMYIMSQKSQLRNFSSNCLQYPPVSISKILGYYTI